MALYSLYIYILRQDFILWPKLASVSLWSPSWTQAPDSPASAFQEQGLQVCTTVISFSEYLSGPQPPQFTGGYSGAQRQRDT